MCNKKRWIVTDEEFVEKAYIVCELKTKEEYDCYLIMIVVIKMRFCDFFIEYKIGLKDIKILIPWKQLPLYRKNFVTILVALLITSGMVALLLNKVIFFVVIIFIGVFVLGIAFSIIDSTKQNQRKMLDDFYVLYSQKRMKMLFEILKKYQINYKDSDKINMLIAQAEKEKESNNPIVPLKKPFKILGTIIIPIVVYVAKELTDIVNKYELLTMTLIVCMVIICLFSIVISLYPVIKELYYIDGKKYDYLIYDLKQILIFYNDK